LPEGYGWDDHRKDEGAEIPGGCWSSLKRNQGILSENLKEIMLLQLKNWCCPAKTFPANPLTGSGDP